MELTLEDTQRVSPPTIGERYRLQAWRDEMDAAYLDLQGFQNEAIDDIFMKLAGFSARFSFIRSQLVRLQTRAANAFRTQEVDPFLEELDRQFKLYSRLQSVREMEFRLSGGAI